MSYRRREKMRATPSKCRQTRPHRSVWKPPAGRNLYPGPRKTVARVPAPNPVTALHGCGFAHLVTLTGLRGGIKACRRIYSAPHPVGHHALWFLRDVLGDQSVDGNAAGAPRQWPCSVCVVSRTSWGNKRGSTRRLRSSSGGIREMHVASSSFSCWVSVSKTKNLHRKWRSWCFNDPSCVKNKDSGFKQPQVFVFWQMRMTFRPVRCAFVFFLTSGFGDIAIVVVFQNWQLEWRFEVFKQLFMLLNDNSCFKNKNSGFKQPLLFIFDRSKYFVWICILWQADLNAARLQLFFSSLTFQMRFRELFKQLFLCVSAKVCKMKTKIPALTNLHRLFLTYTNDILGSWCAFFFDKRIWIRRDCSCF